MYPTTPHHIVTLVLCRVVYLCQFKGCLECMSLGIFGFFKHFGFGGSIGPAVKKTTH